MRIVPAIDLLEGRAVRLLRGRYEEVTVYDADLDATCARAAAWRGKVPLLHVVDLAGARAGRPTQLEAVRAIARAFGPGVQVGGGCSAGDHGLAVPSNPVWMSNPTSPSASADITGEASSVWPIVTVEIVTDQNSPFP